MADPVARDCQVLVARIVAVRQVPLAQERAQLVTADIEQRTDHVSGAAADPGETGRPRAAHQTEQHGLREVVPRVRRSDAVGRAAGNEPGELFVADAMPGRFDRSPVGVGPHADVDPFDHDRHPQVSRERLAEPLVCVRIGAPQPVVQVEQAGNRPVGLRRQVREDRRERDRVATARERHRDAPSGRNQLILINRPQDAPMERRQAGAKPVNASFYDGAGAGT